MRTRLLLLATLLSLTACGTQTIKPNYQNSNPNLQVGGEQPIAAAPTIENSGSFCMKVTEVWHADGKTPDGQKLWTRDTLRQVVPCQ